LGGDKIKGGCKAGNPYHLTANPTEIKLNTQLGRFPANVILDEEAGRLLDAQSGELTSGDLTGQKVGFREGKFIWRF